jgi:hypothetical protein
LANSIIVAALTPNEFVPLAVSPGRNAVAIVVAALLPVIYARMSGATAAIIAIVALTVIPSVLAKLVFGIGAPWLFVLGGQRRLCGRRVRGLSRHRANGRQLAVRRDAITPMIHRRCSSELHSMGRAIGWPSCRRRLVAPG